MRSAERLLKAQAQRGALRRTRCGGRDESGEKDRDGGAGAGWHDGPIVRTPSRPVKPDPTHMGRSDLEDGTPGPYRALRARPIIDRGAVNAADETTVLEEIRELLSAPAEGAGAPTLARLEDTLTEGYAQALALEAERIRLERRLGEVAREAGAGDPSRLSTELASLAGRLTSADGELAKLRALLGSLYERTRTRRRLAAQS